MGTWTAFYVKSERAPVVAACREWLAETGKLEVTESQGPFPEKVKFHVRGKVPRRLLVGQQSELWCEVHYDGFYSPNRVARDISATLQTTVVDTVAQTTSDAYELTVYETGTQKRRLEFAEFEWIAQEGQPLANEPIPLATPDEDDMESELCAFHYDEMARYCDEVFGIEFWRAPEQVEEWIDLRCQRRGILGWFRT